MAGPVIITRAEPGNSQTATRLQERDIPLVKAPMLDLRPTGQNLKNIDTFQGVIFTSANGVRAFCADTERRDLTAWCVGPATLQAAETAGFVALQHADGDADDLAQLVIAHADAGAGALLHVANAAAAGKLAKTLRAARFDVEFAPLYEAVPANALPVSVTTALAGPAVCVVLVHSAKGAEAFANLTQDLVLTPHHLVAVSQAAARPLVSRNFNRVHCAERPNETALLAALFSAYSTL